MNYTYILRCADDSLYTGWTNNIFHRIDAHNDGTGGKYTRARLPVKLVYSEEFAEKQDAQRREYAIKQMTRQEKERLIAEHSDSIEKLINQASVFGSPIFTNPTPPRKCNSLPTIFQTAHSLDGITLFCHLFVPPVNIIRFATSGRKPDSSISIRSIVAAPHSLSKSEPFI